MEHQTGTENGDVGYDRTRSRVQVRGADSGERSQVDGDCGAKLE